MIQELTGLATMPLRVPRDAAGLVKELTAPHEYRRLRASDVYAGIGVRDGEGLPVLLLPGFFTSETSLVVMGRWLHRNGYAPQRAGRRLNVACSEESVRSLERRLEHIVKDHDRRVALVGHSRGGQFARVLGRRRPDLVAGVITLGTPTLDPRGVSLAAGVPAIATVTLGTARVPGFWKVSCFVGNCCSDFRVDLTAPPLPDVPEVAIRSPRDGIVDYGRLPDLGAQAVRVPASHVGMIVNPDVYEAVADALAPLI